MPRADCVAVMRDYWKYRKLQTWDWKKCAPGPKKALTGVGMRRQYSGETICHRCLAHTQATGPFRVCYIVSC
jgi:hypothetical protein